MGIDELRAKIATVNAQCSSLNNTRQVNIGKRETLQKQLDAELKRYKDAYGVDLSHANLNEEMSKVQSDLEQQLTSIETVIRLINEGNYDEANRISKEGLGTVEAPVEITESAEEQAVTMPVVSSAPAPQTVEPESVPVAPVAPSAPVAPVTPVAPVQMPNPMPQTVQPSTPPVAPSAPVAPMGDILSGFTRGSETVQPPVSRPAPVSFQDIIGGTDFQ